MDADYLNVVFDRVEKLAKRNDYYVKMAEGKARPVTEFFEVEPGISFKDFNGYINSLDEKYQIKYCNSGSSNR